MLKLEDIEKLIDSPTQCWIGEDEKELYIKSCLIGNNYYEYGEPAPDELDWSRLSDELKDIIKDDPRIVILDCSDCFGCGSW